jgi:hypothetical protein
MLAMAKNETATQDEYTLGSLTAQLDSQDVPESSSESDQKFLAMMRDIRQAEILTDQDFGVRINTKD